MTLSFLCQELSLEEIAAIVPWLTSEPFPNADELRRELYREMKMLRCACRVDPGSYSTPLATKGQQRVFTRPGCRHKHTNRPVPGRSLPQIKAFMDGYSAAQTRLNAVKVQQLVALAAQYSRHYIRLRMSLAPQSPRQNISHIPQQLRVVAEFIPRILDLDRRREPKTSKHGHCRFRYPHACLIPYDWCLRLWTRVVEAYPSLLDITEKPSPIVLTIQPPPVHIFQCLQIALQGLDRCYEKPTVMNSRPFTMGVPVSRTELNDGAFVHFARSCGLSEGDKLTVSQVFQHFRCTTSRLIYIFVGMPAP